MSSHGGDRPSLPTPEELDITPEMIKAGIAAKYEDSGWLASEEDKMMLIFLAMYEVMVREMFRSDIAKI